MQWEVRNAQIMLFRLHFWWLLVFWSLFGPRKKWVTAQLSRKERQILRGGRRISHALLIRDQNDCEDAVQPAPSQQTNSNLFSLLPNFQKSKDSLVLLPAIVSVFQTRNRRFFCFFFNSCTFRKQDKQIGCTRWKVGTAFFVRFKQMQAPTVLQFLQETPCDQALLSN